MNAQQWRELLLQVSRVILAQDQPENTDSNRPHFAPKIHAAGYIGFEGATEDQICAAESRLGARFPPSYRTFLSVSNGWPVMWDSIQPGELWSTEQIRWTREQDPHLVEILEEFGYDISVEEHLKERGDEFGRHSKHLVSNLLSISEHGDACDLVLCPEVVDKNGEWECWFTSSWGGNRRWAGIEGWFQDVYKFYSKRDDS
jgi:hypothetical protein